MEAGNQYDILDPTNNTPDDILDNYATYKSILTIPMPIWMCPSDNGPEVNDRRNGRWRNGNEKFLVAKSNYIGVSHDGTSNGSTTNSTYTSGQTTRIWGVGFGNFLGSSGGVFPGEFGQMNNPLSLASIDDDTSNVMLAGERSWTYSRGGVEHPVDAANAYLTRCSRRGGGAN